MFSEPKNTFEMVINEVYEAAETFIDNRTFAGLEPITANLLVIYNNLTYEQQINLGDSFYQIFCLTDTEDEE